MINNQDDNLKKIEDILIKKDVKASIKKNIYMKNLTLFFITIFIVITAEAQYVTIPDASFVSWLNINMPSAMNGNQMDTTNSEVISCTYMNISNKQIVNLTGIKYFTSLDTLICESNNLTTLPILPPNLHFLDCRYNDISNIPTLPLFLQYLDCAINILTSLPTLPISLLYLDCHGNNHITSLPALPNSLQELNCSGNLITNIPVLPESLQNLNCGHNQLSFLPILPTSLILLECGDNQLTGLPILPNTIKTLDCRNNTISGTLNLPDSLIWFCCKGNSISSFPSFPNFLKFLICNENNLINLPAFPPSLRVLDCQNNSLLSLPILPNLLVELHCENNQISCFPHFPNMTCQSAFAITGNPFTCLPNYIPAMDSIYYNYPLCIDGDSVNNPFGCVDIQTGLTNIRNKDAIFKVYPIPASDYLIIESTNITVGMNTISIKNTQGREILNQKIFITGKQIFNLSELSNGIYILSIQSKKENYVYKLFISK